MTLSYLDETWSPIMEAADKEVFDLAYAEYEGGCELIVAASTEISEIIQQIRDDLTPLFTDWTRCYLLDTAPVAPVLLESGRDRPIPVGTLPELWERLNLAMVRHAEEQQRGHAAYVRMMRALQLPEPAPPWLCGSRRDQPGPN
jgi:hypothetical protein